MMKEEIKDDNWTLLNWDAFNYIERTKEKFDLIFADPPYGLKGADELPITIFDKGLLEKDGLLVVEHGKETDYSDITQFIEIRKYGGVSFSFFEAE